MIRPFVHHDVQRNHQFLAQILVHHSDLLHTKLVASDHRHESRRPIAAQPALVFARAAATDGEEDRVHGADRRGDEMPDWVANKAARCERKRRVKTIVGAFAERPKLPKMLRRKDLFDTVANGWEQGLFVLSLQRPDGSTRTWWRTRIDEEALNDDALEAVQNPAAVLDAIDANLLAPWKLEGLDWKNGVKIADLFSHSDGYVLTIDHPEEGWTEEKNLGSAGRWAEALCT